MKPILLSLSLVCLVFTVNAQEDFLKSPFTTCQLWLVNGVNQSSIVSNMPEGYNLAMESRDQVVMEKQLGATVEDKILVIYYEGKIKGINFSNDYYRVEDIKRELIILGYVLQNQTKVAAFDVFEYINPTLNLKAYLQVDAAFKELKCSLERLSDDNP